MSKNIGNEFDRTDDKPTATIKDTGVCVSSEELGVMVQMPDPVFVEAVIKPEKQSELDKKPIKLISASRKTIIMNPLVDYLFYEAEQNPDEAEIKDVIPQGKEVFLVGPNIDMPIKIFRRKYLQAVRPALEENMTKENKNVMRRNLRDLLPENLGPNKSHPAWDVPLHVQDPANVLIAMEEEKEL